MKYYIVAGEASGDLHGSNLMKALKQHDPEADFRYWGGDLMEAVGGELVKHYRNMAFMGFIEVAMHLRQILNNIKICEIDLLMYEPDVLILIDYPGFNLRVAEFAHNNGIKVVSECGCPVDAHHASCHAGDGRRVFLIRPTRG